MEYNLPKAGDEVKREVGYNMWYEKMSHRLEGGFTLIELLVVISIIGMLSSVILASLSAARAKAKFGAAITFADHTYHAYGDFTAGGTNNGGYWTFDNSTYIDDSGNGNNCIANPGSALPAYNLANTYKGRGYSIYLDGNSSLNCGSATSVTLTQATLAAWIKTSSNNDSHRGILVRQSGYSLFIFDNQVTAFQWVPGYVNNVAGPLLNDGSWHYIAFSFKSGVPNGSQLYVDGSRVGNAFTYTAGVGSPLCIGTGACGSGQNFIGYIDDPVIYGTALASEDIQRIYAQGLARHLAME